MTERFAANDCCYQLAIHMNVLLLTTADYQPATACERSADDYQAVTKRIRTFCCWLLLIITLSQNVSERFAADDLLFQSAADTANTIECTTYKV